MSLVAGTRVGPYEIISLIGAGGMGEVYKARDTRLDRSVALKVIRTELLEQREALLRFEQEARLLASLNHPRIATIHGFEEFSGTRFLVLEYVPGPTLAERLRRGPLPVREAMLVGKQIAEALEAAHGKGIIHRDLKPANIKVSDHGQVKVLDFGLAKSIDRQGTSGSSEDSATIQDLTREGTVLGTTAYMSPEQACGKELDSRTDIWSFGCVLYEALTSKRAFGGKSVTEILGAVLEREPVWEALPVDTPETVSTLLRRCLRKDVNNRLRDIGDARFLIEDASTSSAVRPPARTWPWAAVGIFALAVVIAWALWLSRGTHPVEKSMISVNLDLDATVSPPSSGVDVLLSPDGTRLAFVSQGQDAKSHLSIRRIDEPRPSELANTEGAYGPFFSPDGHWLGFFSRGKLRKIPVEGGEAFSLADAPAGRGASWSEDGSIIAALDTRAGLSRLSAAGGAVTQLTELDRTRGEVTHRWPQILPGGKAALFTVSTVTANFDEAGIEVVSLVDRRTKILLDRVGTFGRFLPNDYLVYIRKGTLFAARFDLDRLEVRGSPVPVLERVSYDPAKGFPQLDFSPNGSALYRVGTANISRTLHWLDDAGKTTSVRAQPGNYQFPRLSPDGGRLAVTVVEGSSADIWVYDLQRDLPIRVTTGSGIKEFPVWTPDGRYLVFEWQGGAKDGMYWVAADGAGKPEKLTESKYSQSPGNFSPDGKCLVYGELNDKSGSDIRTLQVETRSGGLNPGKSEMFLSTKSTNPYPAFSPDGKWLAYSSTESGTYDVYVRAYPDKGFQWKVSNNGGMMPVWSTAAPELFYRTDDQHLMVAGYTVNSNSFIAHKPRVWPGEPLANLGLTTNFDLAPGGKRFAVVLPAGDKEPAEARNHVILVLNFFDELRRRVPIGK